MKHLIINPNVSERNIGHFFHEQLFHAIDIFLEDNTVKWILLGSDFNKWQEGFTKLMAKYLNIEIVKDDASITNKIKVLTSQKNLRKSANYHKILELVQEAIHKEYPEIEYNGNYKVLYFRNDANRRKMTGYQNQLDKYFDKIIYNMDISFEEQVKLFMNCSHFVTIEGAHLTNVLFMNKKAKVLDISPMNNSWQEMFGTSICVDTFINYYFSLRPSTRKEEDRLFHADIKYNLEIENKIIGFLKT